MNEEIFNKLTIEINKSYYAFDRYQSPSTFAILYFEATLEANKLETFVRITDQFLQIDDNHYFITYSFTEHTDAFKASQNLILYLDKHFQNSSSSLAIDMFDSVKSPKVVISRLFQILNEIRKNSSSRVDDESILSGIV